MSIKLKAMGMLLTPFVIGLSFAPLVSSEVDPEIHKLCNNAADYAGCVKLNSNSYAESIEEKIGNSCPQGYAYRGGGYCQAWLCYKAGIFGKGHDEGLAGKGNYCFDKGREMRWQKEVVPPIHIPSCPNRYPGTGYRTSCHG